MNIKYPAFTESLVFSEGKKKNNLNLTNEMNNSKRQLLQWQIMALKKSTSL